MENKTLPLHIRLNHEVKQERPQKDVRLQK